MVDGKPYTVLSPGVSGRRTIWPWRVGAAAALAVIAATVVISTTAVRQVMAFLVYFILGTCFLLLRCYWLAAAPICGREVARVIYGMARFPTIVWPGSELTAGVSRQKCSWY